MFLVVLIAAFQAALAAGIFGLSVAIADSGRPVPSWLGAVVSVLGTPGRFLSDALRPSLGDPRSIYVGFGLGGVLWGSVIAAITLYARKRRSR